jgi:hypothetical protein
MKVFLLKVAVPSSANPTAFLKPSENVVSVSGSPP